MCPMREPPCLRAVLVTATLSVAVARCGGPTDSSASLARLVVLPTTVSVVEHQSADFIAFGLTAAGDTLAVAVTWSATGGTVADTRTSGGLADGHYRAGAQAGQFHVVASHAASGRSDTAAITVRPPPPPPAGTCLSQAGPSVTLSGLQTSTYDTSSLGDSTKVDAGTAQFVLDTSVNVVVRAGGGTGICWSGGEILGQFPPSTSWSTMHDKYGMIPGSGSSAIGVRIEHLTVFSYGKGISFDDPGIDTDPLPVRERSEEHTSELQSQFHLVCRLLLEKKKNTTSSQETSLY